VCGGMRILQIPIHCNPETSLNVNTIAILLLSISVVFRLRGKTGNATTRTKSTDID